MPVILELAHLVISLLCGNKPVSYSYKLVYQSTLLVGTMGDSRLGNQLADDSHRKASNINQSQTKRKTVWKKENWMRKRVWNSSLKWFRIQKQARNQLWHAIPLWGYTTLFVSLLIWFLVVTTGNYYWQYLWFLLPIIAGTGTYLSTRNQQPGIKTHLDKVINYIWLVFGITGFLISMLAMFSGNFPSCS